MRVRVAVLAFLVALSTAHAVRRIIGQRAWLMRGGSGDAGVADCADGVCRLPTTNGVIDGGDPSDFGDKVQELVKLGWPEKDAEKQLRTSGFDVSEAANALMAEEESNESFRENALKVKEVGWSEEAANSALRTSNGNVTAALELLQSEEVAIQAQFEGAVSDMLQNGWDEVVARRALLAQWSVDQRKSMGLNHTLTAEQIAVIRPTLKRVDPPPAPAPAPAPAAGNQNSGKKPAPVSKESCVFEVTASNFQKLVLESPVPVLVDVYADWCGPCKQLGPVLESAAMQSGGMFRLAKVNSDNERTLAEALQVSGLPTVFSVNNGKFNDRFVGMLPQEELQQFLVRSVTGFGDRVQGADVSEQDLRDATARIGSVAGLAAISFKAREKLRTLVDETMAMPGSMAEDGTVEVGIKTALLYINNAAKDVRTAKFRLINCSAPAFREKVLQSPVALKLLEVAGFRKPENSTATDVLNLVHSNTAVLTLVSQRIAEYAQKNKFGAMRSSNIDLNAEQNKSFRKKGSTGKNAKSRVESEASSVAAVGASAAASAPVSNERSAPAVSVAALSRGKGNSKTKGEKPGGAHTLFSTSIASDTVEYFGGDSTVMEKREEEESDVEEVEESDVEEEEPMGQDGDEDAEDEESS